MSPLSSLYLISSLLLLFSLKYLPSGKNIKLGLILLLSCLIFSFTVSFIECKLYSDYYFLLAVGLGLVIGLLIPTKHKRASSCISLSLMQGLCLICLGLLAFSFYKTHFTFFILSLVFLLPALKSYIFLFFPLKEKNRIPYSLVLSAINIFSGLFFIMIGFIESNPFIIVLSTLLFSISYIYMINLKKSLNFSWGAFLQNFEIAKFFFYAKKTKIHTIKAQDAFYLLEHAKNILIVPGYGFALSQAQSVLKELVKVLENRGSRVYFVIHPLAGRMYGHMNVLLSEMNLDENKIIEADKLEQHLHKMDVCLAIGANDILNFQPNINSKSPLWGMQNLQLNKMKNVLVFNLSDKLGYSGVQNPLFFTKNTKLILGDAKETLQQVISQF